MQRLVENDLVEYAALLRPKWHQEQVLFTQIGVSEFINLLWVVVSNIREQFNGKGLALLTRIFPKEANTVDLCLEATIIHLQVNGFAQNRFKILICQVFRHVQSLSDNHAKSYETRLNKYEIPKKRKKGPKAKKQNR